MLIFCLRSPLSLKNGQMHPSPEQFFAVSSENTAAYEKTI